MQLLDVMDNGQVIEMMQRAEAVVAAQPMSDDEAYESARSAALEEVRRVFAGAGVVGPDPASRVLRLVRGSAQAGDRSDAGEP